MSETALDPAKWRCFLGFHRWTKWGLRHGSVARVFKAGTDPCTVQSRECVDCGKTQTESV